MQSLLEDEGYRVALAGTAREALRIAKSTSPDLIVSDISMPGGTGVELYGWLRREERAPRMIFMSAMSGKTPVPPVPFIEKPFDIDDLLETVSNELAIAG
jgi:adenylate cyclase